MGYELNKLMKQYGVATPTMAGYAEADTAAYNQYRSDYQNRLQNTPMYLQSQFQRQPVAAPTNIQGLYQTYLGRDPEEAGLQGWTRRFADPQTYLAQNPDVAADPYYGKHPLEHYDSYGRAEGRTLTPVVGQAQREEFLKAAAPEMNVRNMPTYGQNIYNGTGSYWGNQLSGPTYARGGAVHELAESALDGAPTAPASPLTGVAGEPAVSTEPLPPPPVSEVYPGETSHGSAAGTTPVAAAPALDARTAGLQSLLEKYGPQDSGYASEVKAARARSEAETKAFTEMIDRMMKSPEDAQSSKAEMYFRLAAAFGSPTRTGHFSENLGLVGKELADYSKSQRASAAEKRNLALEVQKMKMGAAKEDLAAVRSLAGEEMKDRRAIAQELIKDYIQSGKPQSSAGKIAMDEGLQPGSPEFQKRVGQLAELDVQRQMATLNSQLANVTLAQANLALRQQQSARLSPTEIKLKVEAEDLVTNGKQALQDLAEAYRLNPNSLAGSWLEKGQQFLYEAAGSNDPTIVNTRVINNLLGSQGLAKLRATFGGNPTEGERAILLELEGIGSKTKEERATIMRRAYRTLQDRVAREQRRLDDINSGAYRTTEPMPGEQ